MENLPARPRPDLTPSCQARVSHREWITGRAVTLLSHYWRDDDPVELTAAMGGDWADVLEGLPREAIQQAAIRYQRNEPRRKPTPGAIYQMARDAMPRPEVVPVQRTTPEQDAAYRESVRRDKISPERQAEAARILADAAFRMKGTA